MDVKHWIINWLSLTSCSIAELLTHHQCVIHILSGYWLIKIWLFWAQCWTINWSLTLKLSQIFCYWPSKCKGFTLFTINKYWTKRVRNEAAFRSSGVHSNRGVNHGPGGSLPVGTSTQSWRRNEIRDIHHLSPPNLTVISQVFFFFFNMLLTTCETNGTRIWSPLMGLVVWAVWVM